MHENLTAPNRSTAVDAIKTIAILGVLAIHVSSGGFAYAVTSFNWMSSAFWGSLTRASVPLFLMCSGALMLQPEKEYPPKKLFGKNLLRLFLALLFWAFLYQIFHLLTAGTLSPQTFFEAVKHTLLFHHEPHLYYLHIMLLLYLFLPITRLIVRSATQRQLQYLLLLWFIFGIVLPTAKHFWPFTLLRGIPLQYAMNMTYSAIGYGLAGFYLQKYPLKRQLWNFVFFLGGFVLVYGGTVAFSLAQDSLYLVFLEGMSPGVALMAIGQFGIFSNFRYRPGVTKLVGRISKASFCIYLVHMFVLLSLNGCGVTVQRLPTLLSIPLLVLVVFLCSFCLYCLLARIPFVNQYLI